jgi:galactonate dehydratase
VDALARGIVTGHATIRAPVQLKILGSPHAPWRAGEGRFPMSTILAAKRSRLEAIAARTRQAPSSSPDISIRDVTARAVKEPVSGRAYVLVTIETDSGSVGYGETLAGTDAASTLGPIAAHRSNLVGRDALASQPIDAELARLGAPGGVRAAVNMALLDIAGKVAGAPVYELLAGRTRDKARALATLQGDNRQMLLQSLERAKARGFRAFAVPLQVPDGPVRARQFYRDTLELLEALRTAGGTGAQDFVLDCGARATASEASALAAALEGFHPLWIDEPTGPINEDALLKISRENVTPLGWGRSIAGNDAFQNLLRLQAIDVLRPNLATQPMATIRKAAALAEAYYTAFAPYHAGGPVATAAALHIAASTPNFYIQQVPLPADDRDVEMREALAGAGLETPVDGFLQLPTGPGLGVEINEDAVAKYAAA